MNSFAKESFGSFIIKNEGTKININPRFFRIDYNEKIVFYKLENSDAEKKISFKEFDYILIGKNKFKTFKLNNSKDVKGYFVLSETSSKSLLVSSTSNGEGGNTIHYVLYVVGLDDNILDSHEFDNLKKPKSTSMRADIFLKIQFHFKDCSLLLDRLYSYDKDSYQNLNLNLLGFFDSPIYIECI